MDTQPRCPHCQQILSDPPAVSVKDVLSCRLAEPPVVSRYFGGATPASKNMGPVVAGPARDIFDDPAIGGRFTVCILMYGDYYALHKQCLSALMSTTQRHRIQIRVACNQGSSNTEAMLRKLVETDQIHSAYISRVNQLKYPAMRQLFHDPENPITDKWILWFDDDSVANRDKRWLLRLAEAVVHHHPYGVRMLGSRSTHTYSNAQQTWVKSRPWYQNKPFQMENGMEAPNGNCVSCVSTAFFALETEAMRQADLPDPDLGQAGGDFVLAEQLHQAGHRIQNWNEKKQFVLASSASSRGVTFGEEPGSPGFRPAVFAKTEVERLLKIK